MLIIKYKYKLPHKNIIIRLEIFMFQLFQVAVNLKKHLEFLMFRSFIDYLFKK